jgi:hypothetical protein
LIVACLGLAVMVGIVFGATAFVEDVKFAWRRESRDAHPPLRCAVCDGVLERTTTASRR